MPIPADTFWNMRKLNRVFAALALALMAVTGWAIIQDYDREWRTEQRAGRVWEAAKTDEKIHQELVPENQKKIDDQNAQIKTKEAELQSKRDEIAQLTTQIKQGEMKQSSLEFQLNNLKSNVTVWESQLQDAITAGDKANADELYKLLHAPQNRPALNLQTQQLADLKDQIKEAKQKLEKATSERDKAIKEKTRLTANLDLLNKKYRALVPQNLAAKLSAQMRAAYLMGFINPPDKVQQIVLPNVQTDVAFQKITTIDRCTTCHTHITDKDVTREKNLVYLEEQTAAGRKYRFNAADPSKPNAPTSDKPGGVALAEFWHSWGQKLLTDASKKKVLFPLKAIAAAAGKIPVVLDGQPVPATFAYNPDARDSAAVKQDAILTAALRDLYQADPSDGALKTARTAALGYPDKVRVLLKAELPPAAYKELENRYRYALVAEVNTHRRKLGLDLLDPSPVHLAHPNLDLYGDQDSIHNFEQIGCTSCHDGSGQETNFVLTAHMPRPIWVDRKTGEPVLPQQLLPKESPKPHKNNLASLLEAVYPPEAAYPAEASSLHLNPGQQTEEIADANEKSPPTQYVDPLTGRTGTAISQAAYWADKYEKESGTSFEEVYHYWDWPMRPPQYLQANCVRCHNQFHDIREQAPVVYEGRRLFAQLGCVNCHQMDSIPSSDTRKVGTDLRHITAKLSSEFINTWIWAPKAFRPSTKMPHFFMLENNSSDEELRRTRQEARAITEYLVRSATPLPPAHVMGESLHGSPEAGQKLFNTLGCLACHTNLNDTTGETRSTPKGKMPVTVGEKWITTDLIKNGKLEKEIAAKTGKPPAAAELSQEAAKTFDSMTYNQRQLYIMENLEAPEVNDAAPKYPDGSPKPVFMHHGPELSGIGTKLTSGRSTEEAKAWLFDWLKEPRHYSEYTVMPRLRLSDQQAIDLAEYLLAQKRTNANPDDPWKADLTPIDSPKMAELTAFFLRSQYSVAKAKENADNEEILTNLATEALTTPQTAADAAKKTVAGMSKDEKRMVYLGKKLIANYGCMSCHAINGTETISSPCANLSDWGQKAVSKLDYQYLDPHKREELPETSKVMMVNGLGAEAAVLGHAPAMIDGKTPLAKPVEVAWPELEHERTSWIVQKLSNTRIFDRGRVLLEPNPKENYLGLPYEKLKMPTFYLNEEQVHALVTFVISNRDRLITETLLAKVNNDTAKKIARGRQIVEKFNCVNCHQIDSNVPAIQQYFSNDVLTTLAPPSLRGEGNKIQHDWLFHFVKNVVPLRPLPAIRMPSFPLADDEASDVAAYFNSVSVKESIDLKKNLDPVMKYVDQRTKDDLKDDPTPLDPAQAWLSDDWYQQPSLERQTRYLVQWAKDKKQISDIQLDASKNNPEELGKNYRTLLFRARFTADLYNAPYPFVDWPANEVSDERFDRGKQLFYEMQCLKCHMLGDPNQPGANKTPTAPNLSLAHQRLQRTWIRHWVQEPPIIQVGTAMPPFFTGLPVFDLNGQMWPVAQGASEKDGERAKELYGKNVDEETGLLLDFLHEASVRNFTGVQPEKIYQPFPAAPAAPKPKRKHVAAAAPVQAAAAVVAEKPAGPVGSVKGKVVFSGPAPQPAPIDMSAVKECDAMHANQATEETVVVNPDGTLKNVIVWVSDGLPQGQNYPVPADPVAITQEGCMYTPHALAMQAGQTLYIKNNDKFLHNVHGQPTINEAFNLAQPNVDNNPGKAVVLRAAEYFHVKCDVHPWMGANIAVFDHPFFGVTKDDGIFTIGNLPPGTYTLTAKHEKYGTQTQQVTVTANKSAEVTITFKP